MHKRHIIPWSVFWGSVATIGYTYAGFPALVALRGILRPRPVRLGSETPTVSLIIAAYNEADVIGKKLENALALDYPHDKLEILVASDGSDDGTNELVKQYTDSRIQLFALPRQGKNRTLNTVVPQARGDILVFSDADSMLGKDALRHLIAPFTDANVGGVAGDFHYVADGDEGQGERAYWSIDRVLKELESRGGNVTSATGQIFAVRREFFTKLPGTATDDFFISVQVPLNHKRLVFEPKAIARGAVAADDSAEFRRKVRIITRGLTGLWLNRRLLNPFDYGFYAIQLLSHKVLRRLMGIPIALMLLAAPLLWGRSWFYKLATIGQFAFHGAALLGYLLRGTRAGRLKPLGLPFFFDMVNIAALKAAWNVVRGQQFDVWVTQRSAVQTHLNGDGAQEVRQ